MCNSSANYWFSELIPFSLYLAEDFLSKQLWTIEARHLSYPICFGSLAILNALSCNTLSEAVLFVNIWINTLE